MIHFTEATEEGREKKKRMIRSATNLFCKRAQTKQEEEGTEQPFKGDKFMVRVKGKWCPQPQLPRQRRVEAQPEEHGVVGCGGSQNLLQCTQTTQKPL